MPAFTPKPLDEIDGRVRQVELYLARQGFNPTNLAVEGQTEGLDTPTGSTASTVEIFDDLFDVDVVDAANGYVPVYDGTNWLAQSWVPVWGIGLSAPPTKGILEAQTAHLSTFFRDTSAILSGQRAWVLDKLSAAETTPHGWLFTVAGDEATAWGMGVDAATSGNGRADWVPVNDATANAGAGADNFRWSHEADSNETGVHATSSQTVKWVMGRVVGTPSAQTEFGLIDGGDNVTALGGTRIKYWDNGTTRYCLPLENRHATSHRAGILFDGIWEFTTDPTAAGSQELAMAISGVTYWQILSPGQVTQSYRDGGLATAPYPYRLEHRLTAGTPAAGHGVGQQFYAENASNVSVEVAALQAVLTDVTAGSHAGYLAIYADSAGAGVERARFHGDGRGGTSSGGANPLATNVLWNMTKTAAAAPSIRNYLRVSAVADTSVTVEMTDAYFSLNRTVTFAGNVTDQRAVRIDAPIYDGVSAGRTITNPSTVYIAGAPSTTTLMTFTNGPYSLFVDAGLARFDGNGTHVFELPSDTTAAGAYKGRIPVLINGTLQYLHYFDA